MESFSDGVMAIIVTLLIFEVRLPHLLPDPTWTQVAAALHTVTPKFISFAVSFFTVAIFWVNHHHFMHRLTKTDWKLLWLNNMLLFWLTVIPFTTAMIGDHPTTPSIVSIYALNLCLAGLSFNFMSRYAYGSGHLVDVEIPLEDRRRHRRRAYFGTAMYGATTIVALVYVPLALAILVIIPFLFVAPRLLGQADDEEMP
jgi:uncharacterized membrane protein